MEKVYKTMMGYKAEDEKHDCTHCILTVEEYEQLVAERDSARRETRLTVEKANQEIQDYKESLEKQVKEIQNKASERIKDLQSDLDGANEEIYRLDNLNANLLRIGRERANSKRGLKPKKTHHGYLIVNMQKATHRFVFSEKRTYINEKSCWRVRLQTPYDATLPFVSVREMIKKDCKEVFGGALGIKKYLKNMDKYSSSALNDLWLEEDNFIFGEDYNANLKSGLWEVIYEVRYSITIPEDMRVS